MRPVGSLGSAQVSGSRLSTFAVLSGYAARLFDYHFDIDARAFPRPASGSRDPDGRTTSTRPQ